MRQKVLVATWATTLLLVSQSAMAQTLGDKEGARSLPDNAAAQTMAAPEVVAASASGGNGAAPREPDDRPDLGLWNFFTAGWDEESSKRVRPTGTPDFALLRVQTNFMEREVRVNYFFQNNIRTKTRENLDNVDAFIAYAFNRRVMVEVLGNYQWVDARGKTTDTDGGAPQFIGRVQLIDTPTSSYTFNCRVLAPNRGIGEKETTFSYGFAGFEDVSAYVDVDRVGFYYSVLFDSFAGPSAAGVRRNDVAYDISIAKTLTDPNFPIFGSFTVFVENYAQTDLDGDNSGHTIVTVTPGVRFNLGKIAGVKLGFDNWILAGVDVPIAGPHPWDATYRVSYIKNF